MKMFRKTLQREVWFLEAKLWLSFSSGRTAVVKPSEVPALTPDHSFIERKVSLNVLFPLGRRHLWAAENLSI
jgi:hypothetical protein